MGADGYSEELATIYREGYGVGLKRLPCKNPYGGCALVRLWVVMYRQRRM